MATHPGIFTGFAQNCTKYLHASQYVTPAVKIITVVEVITQPNYSFLSFVIYRLLYFPVMCWLLFTRDLPLIAVLGLVLIDHNFISTGISIPACIHTFSVNTWVKVNVKDGLADHLLKYITHFIIYFMNNNIFVVDKCLLLLKTIFINYYFSN